MKASLILTILGGCHTPQYGFDADPVMLMATRRYFIL
jgi:hypothetical protein